MSEFVWELKKILVWGGLLKEEFLGNNDYKYTPTEKVSNVTFVGDVAYIELKNEKIIKIYFVTLDFSTQTYGALALKTHNKENGKIDETLLKFKNNTTFSILKDNLPNWKVKGDPYFYKDTEELDDLYETLSTEINKYINLWN